jgi:hypothetical protein
LSKERSLTLLKCITELALKDQHAIKVKAICSGFTSSAIMTLDDKLLSDSSSEEFTLLGYESKENEGGINKFQLLTCKPTNPEEACKYYFHGMLTLQYKGGSMMGTVSVRPDIAEQIERLITELNSTYNIRNMPVPPPSGISHTG